MKVPMLNLKAQYSQIREEILKTIEEVLETQQFRGGDVLTRFEEEIKTFIQCSYAVGVGSGTDALIIGLKALGLQPGDEVITTPFSFIATASSIVLAGGIPVFADIEPDTYHLNPDEVVRKISERTKILLPVHLYGQCADMPSFISLAKRYSLQILEDSAQAIGAQLLGKNAGNWGDASAFSFYPTKNLGAMGEGGLITTNKEKVAERIVLLRCHGSKKTYEHELIGYNSHLHTLQAGILSVKLRYLQQWNENRRKIAHYYSERMKELSELKLPVEREHSYAVYHQYVIRIPDRESARQFLHQRGISTSVFYPIPIHHQPCFQNFASSRERYPEAEKASREVLALPIYPEMTTEEVDYVVEGIKSYLAHKR